jgi:DNA repair protein RecO (recombination protein O)
MIAAHEFEDWAPLFVRWEIGLLNELGFGLDLARCAATGSADELIYVSPRTGRAVSRQAGEPYRTRLLGLPAFLLGRQAGEASAGDLLAGLQLTAHFLEQWVLTPHDRTIPEARIRLTDLAARAMSESS